MSAMMSRRSTGTAIRKLCTLSIQTIFYEAVTSSHEEIMPERTHDKSNMQMHICHMPSYHLMHCELICFVFCWRKCKVNDSVNIKLFIGMQRPIALDGSPHDLCCLHHVSVSRPAGMLTSSFASSGKANSQRPLSMPCMSF